MAGTETPPVGSRLKTRALRLFTLTVTKLAAQRCLSKLFTRSGGTILYLNFCIKYGNAVTLAEANALQFIGKHTSVPVPKVHHAFAYHGRTYILMERIRGETIANRWHALSDTSKSLIFSQLKGMVEEIRSVPSPTNGVCNLEGGPIHDYRLPQTPSWGPFGTISDFHLALRNNITLEALKVSEPDSLSPAAISDVKKLIAFHESITRPPVLTHGDLSSLNVLVRDDKVVGIIDWDTAGWLPYYWEYTRAWHANPQNQFWQGEVGNFLEEQREELSMELLRRRYFGEI